LTADIGGFPSLAEGVAPLIRLQNGGILAHPFAERKHLFVQGLTRTPVRVRLVCERMFVQDGARNVFPRPRHRRGWGRVVLVAAVLAIATARLAYGSGPVATDQVVVEPGDTLWSIAASHYHGDPRPHVEAILQLNHLDSPRLLPGQALRLPRE
jgi:LysM repeat protein